MLIIDFLINNAEEMICPKTKAKKRDNKVGLKYPKVIINIWVKRTWYNLAFENSLNNFFLKSPYLIISKNPKNNTPVGINQ